MMSRDYSDLIDVEDSAELAKSSSDQEPANPPWKKSFPNVLLVATLVAFLFGYHLGVVNEPLESISIDLGFRGNTLEEVALSSSHHSYLAAKSEADHYMRELKREQEEIVTMPDTEAAEVAEILSGYGIQAHEYAPVVNALRKNPRAWLDFMMKFELGLEKPDPKRAIQSAITIAIAYIVGGLVPLLPYIFIPTATEAVLVSVALTLVALLIFGYAKGHFTGNKPFLSALQTAFIGAIASAAAFGMAKAVRG